MAEINLLPEQKKQDAYGIKIGNSGKKFIRIGVTLVGVVICIYAGIYLYFFVRDQFVAGSTSALESKIRALQSTEQKIILLRNRIEKTNAILSAPKTNDESLSFISLAESLPEGIILREIKMRPEELTFTINADQSHQITEFIKLLTASGRYKQIEVLSMAFSSKERYLVELKTVNLPTQN
jgi:Tfp pilus assembly protein PilN